jgi:hypothetical protein
VRRFSRRTTIITTGMVLVAATSVVAYAFWTGVGSGTGEASTGDAPKPLVVHQTTTVTGLLPGAPPVTLEGNFDNPNASGVFINQVTATISSVTPGSDGTKPHCTAGDFALVGPATVGAEIPPGTGVGSWSGITLQLVNNPTQNQDNCKNATVSISYGTN